MPSRRHLLATVGAAGASGLAGCAGSSRSAYSPGTDETAEWPMPAYDRGFSAYNPGAAAPREGVTERWSTGVAHPSARPVVAAGLVLVPTAPALLALDLDTGEERWRYGREKPWPTAPVVRDGTAYVGFADRRGIVALDVETGEERWQVETRGGVGAAPTFDLGYDSLYAGDDTGRLYRVDAETGEVTATGEVFGPVTALAHDHSLLVGTESGEVYRLFEHYGELTGQWRRKVDGWVRSLLAPPNGGVLVGTFGGPTYRLLSGADVGASLWEVAQGSTHLAVADGAVLGSDGGGLRRLDVREGTTDWQREGDFGAAPAVAGDTVYAGGGEVGAEGSGFVAAYALSGGTGVGPLTFGGERWRFAVDSAVVTGVAVADGAVFAVTQDIDASPSRVYALDPA